MAGSGPVPWRPLSPFEAKSSKDTNWRLGKTKARESLLSASKIELPASHRMEWLGGTEEEIRAILVGGTLSETRQLCNTDSLKPRRKTSYLASFLCLNLLLLE